MFDAVQTMLIQYVDILMVMIPLLLVFDIVGDMLWRQ